MKNKITKKDLEDLYHEKWAGKVVVWFDGKYFDASTGEQVRIKEGIVEKLLCDSARNLEEVFLRDVMEKYFPLGDPSGCVGFRKSKIEETINILESILGTLKHIKKEMVK